MTPKEIIYLVSDGSIYDVLIVIVTDFKVITLLFGGAVVGLLRKWTAWTPWKSDDAIADKVAERLGLK